MALLKWFVFLLGICATGVGLALIPLPGPGVPILIFIAMPCFMYSSPRAHAWLMNNRWCGQEIRDWKMHGVISRKAKTKALFMIAIGLTCMLIWMPPSPMKWGFMAAILLGVLFITTRPSSPPGRSL